jgi:hypothetical protein
MNAKYRAASRQSDMSDMKAAAQKHETKNRTKKKAAGS